MPFGRGIRKMEIKIETLQELEKEKTKLIQSIDDLRSLLKMFIIENEKLAKKHREKSQIQELREITWMHKYL